MRVISNIELLAIGGGKVEAKPTQPAPTTTSVTPYPNPFECSKWPPCYL